MPQGALAMLVLRILQSGPLHGYAIAQRIRQLSDAVLEAEEGSLTRRSNACSWKGGCPRTGGLQRLSGGFVFTH